MKTLKLILLSVAFSCSTFVTTAQLLNCGVNAGWNYYINPNNVHVFTDSSSVVPGTGWQITSHYWTFGDTVNNNATGTNVTHHFSHPGHFTVCEYVIAAISNGGTTTYCTDTLCQDVYNCNGMVQATFTASVSGNTVIYTGTGSSNYPPLTYFWYFPGGNPATSTTPVTTVTYNSPGVHQACLTVTDANGCSAQYCSSTTTANTGCGNIHANFNAQPSANTVALSSTSTGTGTGTLYQWWMDGQPLTNPNPNTAYTASNVGAGNHSFCLYVYANQNTFCDSICKSVTVGNCGVTAAFQQAVNGNNVTFYQSANPSGAISTWNFGDGSTGSDTALSFHHIYPSNPVSTTYWVCHYVSIPGSNCVDSMCHYVVIPGNTNNCGTAAFTTTQSAGHLTLTSTSTGTGLASQFVWTITPVNGTTVQTGSGSPFTTQTLANGYYTVCLLLFGPNQVLCDSVCLTILVNSNTNCAGVNAQWTQTYNNNNSVTFTSSNQQNNAVYHWDFGDGHFSTAPNPTHSYANGGLYTVCLVVSVPGTICVDSVCHNIQANAGTNCTIQAFILSNINSNGGWGLVANPGDSLIVTYQWSTGAITHDIVVTTAGTYCVTVIDANGCSGSTCITVGNNNCGITAGFQFTVNSPSATFYPASNTTAQVQAYWNFGDGTTSNDTSSVVVHTFPVNPNTVTYNVCHYVYVPGTNCSVSSCHTVTIPGSGSNCGIASFTAVDSGMFIYATSTSNPVSVNSHYYWTLTGANGNLIQTQSGTNTSFVAGPLTPGTYTVCLYLYGANSSIFCDSTCHTITIAGSNPCYSLNASWTHAVLNTGAIQFYPVNNTANVFSHWNFGDGTSSTAYSPVHSYTTSGTYTVCHILSIPGSNCADTICQSITVTGANPCSGFSVHINPVTNNNGVSGLHAVVNGTNANYTYNWSNGATTSTIYPTTAGVYCVTVYNNNQCSASDCDSVVTNTPNCHAQFTYAHINCNTIQFSNTSSGGYTNQIWSFGDGTSSSSANPVHHFSAGTWTVQLTVYSSGTNCQSTYYAVVTIQPCGIFDTICGVVFNDVNGNGVQDTSELGMSGGTVYVNNQMYAPVNAHGEYVLVLPVGTYTLYYCAPTGYTFTIPVNTQNPNNGTLNNCATYTISTTGGHHCGYNFGLQNNNATICGLVYNDANNNHQVDNGETGISNVHVILTSANGNVLNAYTNANGEYCVTVPAGTYTITVITNNNLGTVTPTSITVTVAAGGNSQHNDFGIYYQQGGGCNLSIQITPHTTITAGFPAWYDLQVCNVGSVVTSGTVNLFFDPALTFNYAQPAQTSFNNSTHTASWNINNLAPGSCQGIWVSLTADTTIQINQFIFTLANVTTNGCNDVDQTNNVDTVHQAVTGSWDPNNKLVLPAGEGADGKITATQELTYTVNFQNTGNAPAVNVVVRDMIDDDLDLETFRMIGASHPYAMQFNGREAIWKFSAIMLPDSTTNEPASHGYVSFAIQPNAGLAEGTQLNNTADIYFDYNTAIVTNTTKNTIDYALSVEHLQNENVTITLMPNPFKDYTSIKIEGENTSYQLKVYDMLGKLIRQDVTTNNIFSIQRESLSAGVYMYQVTKGDQLIGKGKMIAE